MAAAGGGSGPKWRGEADARPGSSDVVETVKPTDAAPRAGDTSRPVGETPPYGPTPPPPRCEVSDESTVTPSVFKDPSGGSKSRPTATMEVIAIGRYHLLRCVGTGAHGQVFEAIDPELGRHVAVKLPRAGRVLSADDVERFRAEGRVLARLRHPGLVAVFDAGLTSDGRPFVVSELIDGAALETRLERDGKFPPAEAVRLVIEAADALAAAHAAGVVHRDVKPANLMTERGGDLRVADFGIALPEDLQELARGEVLGSPAYMAPEQFTGDAHLLDGRADIWALGVVLYELVTGRRPFVSQDFHALKEDVLRRDPRPARQYERKLPPWIDGVIARCLAKRPADRYATASDLAAALRAGPEPVRRRPGRVLALFAFLLIAGSLAAAPFVFPDAMPEPVSQWLLAHWHDMPRPADLPDAPETEPSAETAVAPSVSQIGDEESPDAQTADAETAGAQVTAAETSAAAMPVVTPEPALELSGTVVPADATVTVNGRPVETDGGAWTWSADEPTEVTLAAVRDGYEAWSRTLPSSAGRQSVSIDLKRSPVIELFGTIDPPDATLSVDGAPVKVAAGDWRWTSYSQPPVTLLAHHPNFADSRRTVAEPGRHALAIALDPLVSISPPDAVVTVDGGRVPVEKGRVAVHVSPHGRTLVSLTHGRDTKTFHVTRRSLAESNHILKLPLTPPPVPIPAPTPMPVEPVPPQPLVAEFDAAAARAAQEAWAESLGAPVFEKNSVGMELALIPPGRYTIGRNENVAAHDHPLPAEAVAVDAPFRMGTAEVTQGQWRRVMNSQPWEDEEVSVGDDLPAVFVSWEDANEFCRRLAELEKPAAGAKASTYRLPSEVEWEWACRAGSQGRFACPDDAIDRYGWFQGHDGGAADLHRVGQLARNGFGLFDMHGNVAEWCGDVFVSRTPAGAAPAPDRAIRRGGSWSRSADHATAASREAFRRNHKTNNTGFRVVRTVESGSRQLPKEQP